MDIGNKAYFLPQIGRQASVQRGGLRFCLVIPIPWILLQPLPHGELPSRYKQSLIIIQKTGIPVSRPLQARKLARASLLSLVLGVEHPSSNVTKMNHV